MKKLILWLLGTLVISILISLVLFLLGLPIFIVFAFLPLLWTAPKFGESEELIKVEDIRSFRVTRKHPYRFCPVCGFELKGWENYCPHCGFKLTRE